MASKKFCRVTYDWAGPRSSRAKPVSVWLVANGQTAPSHSHVPAKGGVASFGGGQAARRPEAVDLDKLPPCFCVLGRGEVEGPGDEPNCFAGVRETAVFEADLKEFRVGIPQRSDHYCTKRLGLGGETIGDFRPASQLSDSGNRAGVGGHVAVDRGADMPGVPVARDRFLHAVAHIVLPEQAVGALAFGFPLVVIRDQVVDESDQ
jgi:hypothetical protein